jgi:nucleoid-associated protein YgaU
MSSKGKAVIAVCIVAGILGLIIFDLAVSPGKTKPPAPVPATDGGEQVIKLIGESLTPSNEPPTAQKGTSQVDEPPATTPEKAAPEEYEVKSNDNIWNLAKAKYGDGKEWKRIVEANPGLNPNALPVGKKIVIPARPAATSMKGAHEISTNSQIHTVETGETLTSISQKYFKTVKFAKAIFDANKELIKSPDRLKPGLQIVIPNVNPPAAATPAPAAAPEATPPPAAGEKKVHKVAQGDSLWKIAASYDPQHVGEMMDKIVAANGDKLESKTTMLKVGWELVIPE